MKIEMQRIIAAGRITGLGEPNFSRDRGEVKKFYTSLDGHFAWLSDSRPTQQARQVIQLIQNARSKGLDPGNYDGPRLQSELDSLGNEKSAAESAEVRFDLALTVSAMRYISDLYAGRMNPVAFGFELNVKHHKLGLAQFLKDQVVGAQDVGTAIASIEPQIPEYQRTEQALGRYLNLAAAEKPANRLPPIAKTVKPGGIYRGVPELARRLATLGDLSPDQAQKSTGTKYEGELVDAVKKFQRENGLDDKGDLGPETLRALNASPESRIIHIAATLEHWRWLPRTESRLIVVNIPAYSLEALDDQFRTELSMKVVVGDAYDHKTPELASEIKTVIFRPFWEVPLTIQKKELAPKIARNPKYLDTNDFEIVSAAGKPVERSSRVELAGLRSGILKLRQKPGPDNAVGLVKFEFPNTGSVYLHGTPEKKLFDRKSRDLSHGCIRVEDPAALAAWVLRDSQGWSVDRVNAAMDGDKTERVPVAQPVPVWIVYATAVAAEDGSLTVHNDIYRYDEQFQRATRNAGTGARERSTSREKSAKNHGANDP
ncbi:MAG TPA: L,D-transpeptidase family protein [Candidatus Acidoferrales bacterium]|nr:L,D-transpeptidase family protein [Candidatus Acidoferrales bacterium]